MKYATARFGWKLHMQILHSRGGRDNNCKQCINGLSNGLSRVHKYDREIMWQRKNLEQ